jgi:PKD repeat protein
MALSLLILGLLTVSGCTPWNGSSNSPPIAAISAQPQTGRSPLDVHFSGTASSDDEPLATYEWRFGDGSASNEAQLGACCDHRFTHPGTYTVVLTVTDRDGLTASASQQIVALNSEPLASCRLSNDAPLPNEVVRFDASGSLDLDGEIVECAWDFGDGTALRGIDVAHAYDEVGTYTVCLTVTDDAGASATTTHVVYVHLGASGGGCSGGGGVCL